MESVKLSIQDALESEVPTPFAVGGPAGALPQPSLTIHVQGVPITLGPPLTDPDTTVLQGAMARAPFGRGEATLHDLAVRNCLQLDNAQFALSPAFLSAVQALAARACASLGVRASVTAQPYKLVMYEEGGLFLPHKDSVKARGMFGTLVVQLPSAFTGGALCVRHAREEQVFEHAAESAGLMQYAAFFADCEHEVRPIRSGRRLCLLFNLVRGDSASGSDSDYSSKHAVDHCAVGGLVEAAEEWSALLRDPSATPVNTKLLVPLGHEYTSDGVELGGFDELKGRDATLVEMLRQSKRFGFGLALVEKYRNGGYEYSDEVRDPYAEVDDEEEDDDEGGSEREDSPEKEDDPNVEHTITELCEETIKVLSWHKHESIAPDIDATQLQLNEIRDVLDSDTPLFGPTPHNEEYSGYTGNEGATAEHWYRSAALVVWPVGATFRLWCETDVTSAFAHVLTLSQSANAAAAARRVCDLLEHVRVHGDLPYDERVRLLEIATRLGRADAVRLALCALAEEQRPCLKGLSSWEQHNKCVQHKSLQHARGVATDAAVQALSDALRFACDNVRLPSSSGRTSVEEAIAATLTSTPPHALTKLVAFASGVDAAFGADATARRVVDAAARAAAQVCDVEIGARERDVLAMATRADAAFDKKLVAEVETWTKTEDTPSYTVQRNMSRLMKLAGQCAHSCSSVSWAVVRAFVSAAMLRDVGDVDERTRAARAVWSALLCCIAGRVEHCDVPGAKIAEELAEQMLTLCASSRNADNVLCAMAGRRWRDAEQTASSNALAKTFLERAVRLRIERLVPRARKPVSRWMFGSAEIKGHPRVTAFLRGDEQHMTYGGDGEFCGIGAARQFAAEWFDSDETARVGWKRTVVHGGEDRREYSATASADGRGRAASVTMVKTQRWYNAQTAEYNRDCDELAELRKWLGRSERAESAGLQNVEVTEVEKKE